MPSYKLIVRDDDGEREDGVLEAELGSGVEVGKPMLRDGEPWVIVDVRRGDDGTALVISRQH